MGIFERLAQVLRSNLNDLVSRSEDPTKMLAQVLLELEQQHAEARRFVALVIAEEKKLGYLLQTEQATASEWERKAMLAVRAGQDDLARAALARKKEHDELAAEYEAQWRKQAASVRTLLRALDALKDRIAEARRKKVVLEARQKRAEAAKKIQAALATLGNNSAFDAVARMEDRVRQLEAEADAALELEQERSEDALEKRFALLDRERAGEDALAELKKKMGVATGPRVRVEVSPPPAPAVEAPRARAAAKSETEVPAVARATAPQAARAPLPLPPMPPPRGNEEDELEKVLAQLESQRQGGA